MSAKQGAASCKRIKGKNVGAKLTQLWTFITCYSGFHASCEANCQATAKSKGYTIWSKIYIGKTEQ